MEQFRYGVAWKEYAFKREYPERGMTSTGLRESRGPLDAGDSGVDETLRTRSSRSNRSSASLRFDPLLDPPTRRTPYFFVAFGPNGSG